MGIGAPAHTGGFLQFVNTYGLEEFAQRCEQLKKKFGDRFACPKIVREKLSKGQLFV